MWPFSSKESKSKSKSKASQGTPKSSEEIRAQAMAQFRKTEAELGQETIQEMQRQLNYEAAKKKIEDSVDGKGDHTADDVLDNLKRIMDEKKRN